MKHAVQAAVPELLCFSLPACSTAPHPVTDLHLLPHCCKNRRLVGRCCPGLLFARLAESSSWVAGSLAARRGSGVGPWPPRHPLAHPAPALTPAFRLHLTSCVLRPLRQEPVLQPKHPLGDKIPAWNKLGHAGRRLLLPALTASEEESLILMVP